MSVNTDSPQHKDKNIAHLFVTGLPDKYFMFQINLGNIKVTKCYDISFPFQLSYIYYETLVETNRTIVGPSIVNPMLKVTTLYATSCISVVLGRRKQEE